LLINAAKYTEPGGQVHLRAMRVGAEVAVTVRDNGAGIPADVLPRLFTPFSPGASAGQYPSGGLGLGLSLVRGLVQRHGGRGEGGGRGGRGGGGAGARFQRAPATRRVRSAGAAPNRAGAGRCALPPAEGSGRR